MILIVGDAGVDLTVQISHLPGADEKVHASTSQTAAGGVALNTAVALSRFGSHVSLAAEIGTDAFGDLVEATLVKEAVETISLVRNPRISTYYTFSMLAGGDAEKRMVIMPTPSLYPSSVEHVDFADVSWCHTSPFGFEVAGALIKKCRQQGIPFSLDLEPANLNDRVDQIEDLTRDADTVIVNQRSAGQLALSPREAVDALLSRFGARTAIVTLGSQGVVYGFGSEVRELPAYQVTAVDTTGAGDAFAAGYLCHRSEGGSVPEAVQFAAAVGAIACTGLGARGALADRTAVRQLQAQSREVRR